MDDEHISIGPVEPGEDEQLVARSNAPQGVEHLRIELDPRIGRTLVALLGGRLRIGQRRLHPADRSQLEGQCYGRVSQSMSGWA